MSKLITYSFLAVAMTSGLACGDMDEPDGENQATSGLELSIQPTQLVDDAGSQCTNLGLSFRSIHCCPPNMAMVGVHLPSNTFKCSQVGFGFNGSPRHIDLRTQRNAMHSCPPGEVMIGYYAGFSIPFIAGSGTPEGLVCQKPFQDLQIDTEYVDGGITASNDGVMRVCKGWTRTGNTLSATLRYAMTGIHAAGNRLACTR